MALKPIMMAIAGAVVLLAGCKPKAGNGNSVASKPSPLQGKWSTTNISQWPHAGGPKRTIEFGSDGRVRIYFSSPGYDGPVSDTDDKAINYSISGNVITYSMKDGFWWKEEYSTSGGKLALTLVDTTNKDGLGHKVVYETWEEK